MPELVLGPMLRYVSTHEATAWVQTSDPCEVEILGHRARTFCAGSHHYAVVVVSDLEPASSVEYEVRLDGALRWPQPDSEFPPSRIQTLSQEGPFKIAWGSCRVTAPHEPPYTLDVEEDERGSGVDALYVLSRRMRDQDPSEWPQMLLMIGDQIYADEVSPRTAGYISARRGVDREPGDEVLDVDEYTMLYHEAWSQPTLRWLHSTLPTVMLFDDHDVHDDWNTSESWIEDMRRTSWWGERIIAGLFTGRRSRSRCESSSSSSVALMGERTTYTPGTFSWTDLTTPDQAAAKGFYSALFGWEITDIPVDENTSYSMAALGGKPVAAISPQPQQQRDNGVPPLWNAYITVQDADAAVQRAQELGANVHAPAFDVMQAGRMGVIQDPQGAYFLVWQPRDHIGAGLVNAAGALCWNELGSPDLEGSARFYGELFGWTTTPMEGDMPYLIVKNTDGHSNGGIRPPMPPGAPPFWLVYFAVQDIDAAVAKVTEHGGAVLGEPTDIGIARIAVATDPQGAVFALYDGQLDD